MEKLMQLFEGDCLEVMKQIPDASVDLILCDLPYGTTQCTWDAVIPFALLWAHYKRVRKISAPVVLNASQPFTSALGASNIAELRYAWVWEKSRPTGFLNAKKQPLKGFEDVLIFYIRRPVYHPQGIKEVDRLVKNTGTKNVGRNGLKLNQDHAFHGAVSGEEYQQKVTDYPRGIIRFAQEAKAWHPTQKPVALMEYLIRTYTNEGDIVLDNCMGSGTTGVACANTGREFIGIEQNPEYFQIAKSRIDKALAQKRLDGEKIVGLFSEEAAL